MLWSRRRSDSSALHILARWSTIFMILGSTRDGNGLMTVLQEATSSRSDLQLDLVKKSLVSPHSAEINFNLLSTNRQSINKLNSSATATNRNITTTRLNSKNINLAQVENLDHINGNQLTENDGNSTNLKIFFGTANSSSVTYQAGSIAVISCIVHNIDEEVVSWIRRKDYHLLTVGLTTYSSDERFSSIHPLQTEDWTLQIKFVQTRDAGLYECQVSTHPPISIFVHLNVVEARAEIPGPQEKYLKPGSTLRLVCKVLQSTEPPLYLFWYHNNRMINYDLHRGVNVSTESDNRYSELLISQTSLTYSGNYSCVPNNAVPASVLIHILNGENPAAMQHGEHSSALSSKFPSYYLLLLALLLSVLTVYRQ